jgi:nicotinamidase-related amidase
MRCNPTTDLLLVVDLQVPFLDVIFERDRVVSRAGFLIQAARALGVPVIATEQVPDRLGSTHPDVKAALGETAIHAKTAFSAAGAPAVMDELTRLGRSSVVVVGVETHICVCGTALDLLALGYRVTVCPDAVSSRTLEAHKLGMERIRDAGAMPAHTESVAYEWLGSSENPAFKSVLDLVKRHPI